MGLVVGCEGVVISARISFICSGFVVWSWEFQDGEYRYIRPVSFSSESMVFRSEHERRFIVYNRINIILFKNLIIFPNTRK
jgi:hypothetical protein